MLMRFPLFTLPFVIFGYIFIEIAAFIFIGGKIGIMPSLCLVFLSAIGGFCLFSQTLRHSAETIKPGIEYGNPDYTAIGRSLIICFGAILLIIPGFVSSFCGLIMLIPPVRNMLARLMRGTGFRNISSVFGRRKAARPGNQAETIDLEPENYQTRDPEKSPWRKP